MSTPTTKAPCTEMLGKSVSEPYNSYGAMETKFFEALEALDALEAGRVSEAEDIRRQSHIQARHTAHDVDKQKHQWLLHYAGMLDHGFQVYREMEYEKAFSAGPCC